MATFSGMGYPIIDTPMGYFPITTDVDLIKSDLLILLLTNPGERIMMSSYGTPLRSLIFDPNDTLLAERAKEIITNSINTWEPRVIINAINVFNGINSSNRGFLNPNDDLTNANSVLGIQIMFTDPNDIRNIQELVLQVPLASSNTNSVGTTQNSI